MKFGTTAIILIGAGLVTACAKPVVINPSWLHQPGPEALGEAYPVFAAMAGFSGQVTLQCVVEPDGHLSLCQAKKVLPEGLGFDRAALSLAAQYLATPQIIDGEARKASVASFIAFIWGRMNPPRRGQDPSFPPSIWPPAAVWPKCSPPFSNTNRGWTPWIWASIQIGNRRCEPSSSRS